MDLVLSILRCALGMLAVTAASVHSAGRHNRDYSFFSAEHPLPIEGSKGCGLRGALVVDACRHAVRDTGTVVSFAKRPALFALARALGAAWPEDAPRAMPIML